MENKTDIWSSISSVLEGKYTEKEMSDVEEWLSEDNKNRQFFNKLRNTSFSEETEQKAKIAQEHIYAITRYKINKVKLKRKLRLWQYAAAASIALLLVMNGIHLWKTESVTPVYVESKSSVGNTTRLTLGDGTIVELNSGSSICYPLHFNGKNRTVVLNGEAYFEVTKDEKHPFIVEAERMKIKVLGTHFNVKSYENESKLVATLIEGQISVDLDYQNHSANKSIILQPNEQIVFDKNTDEINVSQVNADLYASWKDGQCFFENEKLVDIAKILERQFGIKISITSANLKNQLFSGFFTKEEGLFHILNSFKKNRNLDYRQHETGIELFERE